MAYDSADDSARDERQGAGEAAGQDYRSASGLLTFAPGEIVKTVIIDIVNDSAVEVDEFFKLVLSTPTNASIVDPSGLAQIGANDGEPVSQPTITAKPVATDESQPMTGFTVQLSAPSPNEVTVNFDTDIGTATYGTNDPDYQRVFGTLFFAPGETTKFVAVPIVNNITVEGTALFWLDLTSPVNATIAQRYTPALMFDNDAIAGTPAIGVTDAVVDESAGTASFFVWLSRSSLSVVSVAYDTADDSARDERQGAGETLAQDFRSATGVLTFAPGEIVKTVIIDIVNDSAAEVDEFFKLVLSTPTNASIVDPSGLAQIGANDGLPVSRPTITAKPVATDENQPMTGFTVQLSAPSPNEVKVNFDTDIGTATYGTNDPDYQRVLGTLAFAPGETTKFVAVPVVNNTTVEGTGLFWLDLTSPVNATIEQRYTPALIFDNDAIAGTPAISVTDVVVDESAGTASFFVWLNRQSLSVVTVEFDTVDGSARAGEDYRDALGQLRFAPGEVVKTVSVDIANDHLAETDEVFTLRLANPVNATLHDAVAGAVIGRNDTAPVVQPQITAGQLTVSEADTSAGFVVQLSAPSDRTVTVNFDTAIGTATYGTNSPDFQRVLGTLEFAPGQTTKWIPIPLIDNTTAEGLESFSLDLTSPVNATLAQRLTSATIIDTDSGFNVASRGIGPDQYSVGNVLDRIAESPGGGTDSVRSSVSYTLPDNVENLTLTGAALIGIGNAANNVFRGTSANNTFDGREGIDTAVVSGPLSGYVIAGNATSRTVSGAPDGSDTLLSIERLQFSNTLLANDTTPGGNTYKAYAMFNAGFNQAPSVAELSQWTSALDGLGGNLRDLAQTMITFYAPGVPNDALVTHLWGTIVGTPIPLDALALYTGLLADGTYTQASLLELVTTLDLNTNEIVGIVGQALPLDPAWFPDPGV